MPDPVFERYKETLRAGHVAMLRGRLREALEQYSAAAELADHRALPHVSVGGVLLQLGRAEEALAAFDRALQREPENEAARSGRADALDGLGRFDEAAAVRREMEGHDYEAAEAAAAVSPTIADGATVVHRAADGERLLQGARLAAARGDRAAELEGYSHAAAAYVRADRSDAALDACQRALAIAPGDPDIHLQLARLYFDRGWHDRGVEKLVLLERLITVEPHEAARAQLIDLARERASGEPRLSHVLAVAGDGPEPAGGDVATS